MKGQFTSSAAMQILLKGSDVQVDRSSAGVLLIRRPPRAHTAATRASAAAVGKSAANSPDQPAGALEEVVVTGTSIQSKDSAASESRPVHIVTAQAIRNAGVANLEDFLHAQPDFVLSGQSSFTNSGGTSAGNGTNYGATTVNLRGLGPQYTLVSLNGRRFQAEDPANIDLAPA